MITATNLFEMWALARLLHTDLARLYERMPDDIEILQDRIEELMYVADRARTLAELIADPDQPFLNMVALYEFKNKEEV